MRWILRLRATRFAQDDRGASPQDDTGVLCLRMTSMCRALRVLLRALRLLTLTLFCATPCHSERRVRSTRSRRIHGSFGYALRASLRM